MPTTIVADLRINTAGAYRDIDIFKSKLNRGISQPLGRISGDAAEFSKSLQAAAARVTAFGAITGGILAVNKAISAAARSTIEVNKQLVELNTFLGESQQNLDRFGKSLFNIARATATNFSDVAEAAKEFARQGLSTEETLKRTNDALVLSRVSGLNYAQSVNSITTAINGFNKEALSSTEIISKLIAVDSRFAVSAAQLSEALTRVGSSAEESGLSFDELVATITTAQQITGRGGAVIGNALKTIFTRVRRPEILDQLRQLGVVVEDQNGVLLNGIQILKNYSEATKNLSQAEKSRTAELLGGVYQINQLQAVIRDLSSANSIYSNSLKISISATDEAIKKNEQLNKSYSALISQTAATATQVGSDIGKNLFGPLITGGTSVIQGVLKLLSPEKFEEAGITAGQAMAKGAGQEITKGISSAIGNALLYTGGPVLATIGAGLGIKLIRFIGASLKTQAKEITDPLGRVFTGGSFFGKEEREKLALQTQISGVMQRISGLTKDTATSTYKEATARRQVFQEIKRINLELQRQLSLSRAVASDLRVRGYSDIFEVPAARPTRRRRRSASGYIPNFADPVLMEEEQEARSKSAKNPKAYYTQATIKGKKQVIAVNDQEEIIPNFAGTGDTAIIPRYRKMQDIPRMGSGYVPNFSWSKTNKMPKEFLAKYPKSKAAIKAGRMYSPEVRSMLQKLKSGESIDRDLLETLIERDIPIREVIAPSSIKKLPSKSLIRRALDKEQAKRVGKLSELPAGSSISVRQDVPSMTRKGVGVVKTLGPEGFKSYDSFVAFDNPVMNKSNALERASLAIGAGENKSPLLKISGTLSQNQSLPKDLSSWTQVGFNPDRHSYYYDRKTKTPVIGGSKAIQIGNTVFIKDAKFGKKEDFLYGRGYIPNFAKSKFIENIVNSYKASLTEKDSIRLAQAQKAESYYPLVNSELKNLSSLSGYSLEKLAYSLAALSGNTADLDARRGLERILKNQPYDDLAILPKNVEKVKKMLSSSGSLEELMSILGKGAKTQNFAQSLLLSENFSGFGKYKNPLGTPSVMDSWAIYVRNGGALKAKYDRRAVSNKQKSKLFSQSPAGYKYYNTLVKEYGQAAKILGVPVRELQARTWGWARGQMGSVTRNSFASGYIPNFANNLDYNPNFLVGSGSDAIFLSAYDQLSGEFGGGPAYPEVVPGRSFATTSTGSLNTLNQNAMSIIRGGGKAFFSPVVNSNALESLGGNKFFLMALAKRYPRFSNFRLAREILKSPAGTFKISEIRGATNQIISNIQKNYGRNKGILRAREVAESISDKRFLNPQYKNLSTSLITEIVSNQGSIVAPNSGHSLYNLAALGGASKMSNPVQYQKIFEGLIDKDRLSGLRNSYIPIGRRFNLGDDFSKMLGLASGFIPNFARQNQKTFSPEFKKWFAGSKVVNEQGEPLMVYHGTNASFTTFRQAKEGTYGKGIYVTPDLEMATGYTTESAIGESRHQGGNIMPLYTSLQNPIEVVDKDGLGPLEALKKLGYTSDKAAKVWEKALESKGNLTTQIQKRAELFDNDGIIVRYPDGRIKEIVVFSPGQVKSSIGNKGTFDPLNPDIRYANGFIPNYSGLSDAIGREKTMSGLPASQIMAHFDGKGNPIAVTNKRDEPNGLKDIVPNFARPSLPRDARGRFTRRTIEAPPTPESASKDLIQFIVQTIGVGGLSAILNELYLNERISPEVNTALQIGIPILGGLAGAGRGLRQSRGQSFGRRAASVGVPLGLGVAQAGLNIFSSSQITQDIQRRKLDKEIDAAAREFKSVTEGTQELVDTLSKLDAAFKDASTAPEQLVKLSKRESELVRNLSKTSPELSSKLATEPNLEKRIGIIEDIRREASRQQTIAEEIAYLKSPENKTPEDLNKSFSRFVSAAGENLFKFTSEDLKPENFGKITQESKLERLQEFLKDVDQTTKDKLIPLFLQSVDSEIKFLEANKETNKKISQIRGTEIKKRAEIDRARELRTTRTLALNEGLTDLSSFASQFGPRAAISFGVEADKMKKSLEVSSSFRSLLNLKATDKDLKLPENVSEALSKIENPSTETTNLIREMAKDKNLNQQQKDSLEELAVNSERQTKQLEQISKIGEINKEVQLKVLKIQEKLSFAGGIKTSTDAASRIASINAPLTGALQYRLGSMLGSERSQVSGLTNLLKSIQDKYPGMIDKSVDLKSVTDRLVALRTRDLQKDLFRDAGVLQSVGLGGTANILRTKAADTLSLRNIAETQVGAELQTGENPAEAIRYFGDVVRDSIDSLGAKFAEDRTIKKLESENLPKVQEETRKNEEFRASLQKNITDAIRGSLGDSFKLTGSKFDVSNSTVIINDVIDFLKNPLSYFGIGNTQQTNPPAAPPTTKSGGFIPSFYDPLREAISRESQYVPFNSIRVNQSEKLISSQNPMGLAVTNTIDEPAGLASIGLASRGFVPNFADEQEDIYEPGTAKIPLISKTVGKILTNLTSPLGYDLASKGSDLLAGQFGEGEIGLIPSIILDKPTKSLQKRYQEKAYTSEGRTEFREPLYRWMFGLEPQTDWQKWYVKNPDKSIGFNQNTPEGKNLFRRAVLNAVQARLDFVSSGGVKGASAGRHDVMSNYGYSFEGGKLKFFDRWDFDPHPGEGGLSDYFKSKTEPVPQNIAPGSQYAISNQDTTSGSFGSRLKNSVRGMVSATTAPVTIRGEIPIADLPKFFKENKTIWRYPDSKTGKKLNNYPFLEQDPSSVLRRLNLQNDSIASKASGFIPNFAAFGKNVAQQAIENARAGKLYVWDNIDDIYRKVKSDGSVESEGIRRLPRDAKIISTAIVKGNFNDERNILNLQDPKFTKLDELELPSVARSKKIDRIISKLKKQGQLTPKNLLDKINELSQGRPALVKTAFGTSNFKSKGVYGLEGELTIKDTKSIIDRFNKGTGSGFFIQEKVPTHYNELRVHVAVDENGRVKIVKGGTILKFTGFDPTSQPSVDAYREAGLSRRQATRMARSFKKSAEATAVENIRNIVKNKNIRNAFFGVDVGGTTLEAAIEAGVKPREFYSGGRGRVSTIVFEVNPSEAEGSSGFVGRGVVPKLVKSIMGQKPSQGVAPPEIAILGTNRSGAPRLPAIGGAPTVAPTASGTPNINIKQSSVVNSVKDLALRIKNSKLGSGISGLSGKVAQGASRFLSGSAMNVIGRASGVAGKVTKPLIALGGLGTIGESIGEFKDKNYGLAGLKAGEGSLLLASLAEKATGKIGLGEKLTAKSLGVKNLMNLGGKAFGVASMLGLASEIAYAKNNQLAEDFGDLFLGKKSVDPETGKKYRSTSDLIAGGVGLGFDALAATNPLGQAYIAMKYGYRTGNILEEKLGIGNMLGESFLYAGSTMAERARRAKQSNLGEGISKQDVVEGRVSLEAYLAYKRRLLEEKEAGLENMSRGFIPNFAKGQLTIEEQLEQDKLEIEEQKRKRAEQEEAAKQERIKQAEIAAAAAAKREEQRKVDRARQDEENELRQQESDTRSKLVQGVIENEETNQLYTSRDKANYLISQERIFGTFTRENFKGNEDLYDSYQAYKREKENQAEAERRLMKPKETDFYVEGVTKPELLNKRKAEFARAQETAEATREFRQRAATEAEALGGATAAQRKEAYDKGIPLEKVIPETQRPANFVRAGLGLPPLPSVDKNIINPQTYGEVINGRFYTKDQIKEAYDKGVSVESIKFGNRRIRMPKLPTQEKSKKTKSSFGIEAQFMASITDVGLNIGIFVDGVYYTQSEITEAKKLRISPAELRRRKRKNKSSGFVPNFSVSAFAREKLDVLTSPDYSGYRNAVPQPSKYYKNVIKNSAEIEVPAVEVYNRMGLFGAKPKNSNEQYAILNPAQQAQLGYASKGFVPNFAPEQFAGAVGEAMQKALAPYFEKVGSSVTNSNVININDQRTIQTNSEKVYAVMEFLQDQFPTQFARKMGPQSV